MIATSVDKNIAYLRLDFRMLADQKIKKLIVAAGVACLGLIGSMLMLFLAACSVFYFDVDAFHGLVLRLAAFENNVVLADDAFAYKANVHIDHDSPLMMAAQKGHVEIISLFLDHGADIHAQRDLALYLAVSFHHPDAANMLLSQGAKAWGCEGQVIANRAARDGDIETLKLIHEYQQGHSLSCPELSLPLEE